MASPPARKKKKKCLQTYPAGAKNVALRRCWRIAESSHPVNPGSQWCVCGDTGRVARPAPPRSVCLWRDRFSWGGSVAILSLSVAIHPVKRPFCGDRWRFCGDMATLSPTPSPTGSTPSSNDHFSDQNEGFCGDTQHPITPTPSRTPKIAPLRPSSDSYLHIFV